MIYSKKSYALIWAFAVNFEIYWGVFWEHNNLPIRIEKSRFEDSDFFNAS